MDAKFRRRAQSVSTLLLPPNSVLLYRLAGTRDESRGEIILTLSLDCSIDRVIFSEECSGFFPSNRIVTGKWRKDAEFLGKYPDTSENMRNMRTCVSLLHLPVTIRFLGKNPEHSSENITLSMEGNSLNTVIKAPGIHKMFFGLYEVPSIESCPAISEHYGREWPRTWEADV